MSTSPATGSATSVRWPGIQQETGGFTEFVTLPFIHTNAPVYLAGIARPGPTDRDNRAVTAMARLLLHPHITNIQTSWVKLGTEGAAEMLRSGANDLGGTLMEETISRMAGSSYGSYRSVKDLIAIAEAAGRPAKPRTTLYGEVPAGARDAAAPRTAPAGLLPVLPELRGPLLARRGRCTEGTGGRRTESRVPSKCRRPLRHRSGPQPAVPVRLQCCESERAARREGGTVSTGSHSRLGPRRAAGLPQPGARLPARRRHRRRARRGGRPVTRSTRSVRRTAPDGVTDFVPAYGRRGAVTAATQLTLFTVDGLIRAQVRRDTGAWHPPTDVHRAHLRWAATQQRLGTRRAPQGQRLARPGGVAVRPPRPDPAPASPGFGDETHGHPRASPRTPTARDCGRPDPLGAVRAAGRAGSRSSSSSWPSSARPRPTATPPRMLSAGAFAVIVHGLARGETLDGAVQHALALLAARPGHEQVTDALQQALGAVRQGIPGPARIEALGEGGRRRGGAGRRRVLRAGRRGRAARAAARREPRRAVRGHRGRSAGPCSARCTARPRCRRPGSPSWRAAPRSSNSPTTSRWR